MSVSYYYHLPSSYSNDIFSHRNISVNNKKCCHCRRRNGLLGIPSISMMKCWTSILVATSFTFARITLATSVRMPFAWNARTLSAQPGIAEDVRWQRSLRTPTAATTTLIVLFRQMVTIFGGVQRTMWWEHIKLGEIGFKGVYAAKSSLCFLRQQARCNMPRRKLLLYSVLCGVLWAVGWFFLLEEHTLSTLQCLIHVRTYVCMTQYYCCVNGVVIRVNFNV